MNKVILSGNLTKDIEVIENDKIKLGKFTLAVTKPFKNSKGEYESDFFNSPSCFIINCVSLLYSSRFSIPRSFMAISPYHKLSISVI